MKDTIILEDLSIGYGSKKKPTVVADGINAAITGGELTCLLGSNGVGKSTLLRTLSAFIPKLSGRIVLDGRDLESYSSKELSRTVSVVLTEKPDVGSMPVTELVSLGRSPYTGFWGICGEDDRRAVDEAMEMVGISRLAKRAVATLSDGERQKVMIAKALAQQTDVIFLDEPTAFLDFPSKVEMMQLLHQISSNTGKTVFMSTHDLELALQIADTVWLMDREKGIATGTPEDLAIDGRLGSFFNSKDIRFDRSTGLFRVRGHCTRSIRLSGSDKTMLAMARKALLRNGIETDNVAENGISIKADSGVFYIYKGVTTVTKAATVKEMIETVRGL